VIEEDLKQLIAIYFSFIRGDLIPYEKLESYIPGKIFQGYILWTA